jgi:DNA end-binding protein Ku
MGDKKMAGLARIVLYRRERLVMLEPFQDGILATTLRYKYEVREADAYFEDIPKLTIPAEMRNLAVHIIESRTAKFDPAQFEDRYENAMAELVQAKQAGAPVKATAREARPSNVVNLMDALRRSLEAEGGERRAAAPSRSKRATRSASPATRRKLKKAG